MRYDLGGAALAFESETCPLPGATGPFACHADAAYAAGLVVIPTHASNAKRPLVRWGQLKHQPRRSTIDRWACQFARANLAYLPDPSSLVVLDIDDRRDEDRARALLGIGDTSLIIATGKRGVHLPLRTERPVASLDLRRFGIAGEIKGARSIVVAPGSRHPETGRPYRFVRGDWDAFLQAPLLDVVSLEVLVGARLNGVPQPLRSPGGEINPVGRRNASTFAHLRALGAAGLFSSEAEVLAAGLTYNLAHNRPPEPEQKVIATCKSVWRYIQRGQCKASDNKAHYAGLTGAELAALRSLDPKEHDYADATALYLELKLTHGARARRGETFAIAATAIAEARCLPGWTDRKRYLKATKALIAGGLIECVEGAHLLRWTTADQQPKVTGLRAAQYRFTRIWT